MSLPTTMVNDFYLEVARGNVTGYAAKELNGLNADIDAGTEDLWNQGGSITQVTAAAVLFISTTSALDITQYITVTGLDDNYDEVSEVIGPLTGVVRATGVVPFLRVNSATVSTTLGNPAATTAALLYVSSSNVADNQVVTVIGLDANSESITETFTLNGQTKITGTKYFLSVTSATIASANAGTVYVYFASAIALGIPATTSAIQALIAMPLAGKVYVFYAVAVDGGGVPTNLAKVQAAIDVANTRAYNAIYTVPRNKNWYMTSLAYQSFGSVGVHDIIVTAIRKLYGGSNETAKVIKYTGSATATAYVEGKIQLTDQPVEFPAKSEIRITGNLRAGGTNLTLGVIASFVEETTTTAVANTVTVISLPALLAKMITAGSVNVSQNHWLIGLDEMPGPNVIPTTVNLDDVLTTITGENDLANVIQPYVAADTEVAFDPAYFTGGKLVSTTKKAVFTIMRTVDSAGTIDYVQAPSNMIFSLGNIKKINYLTR